MDTISKVQQDHEHKKIKRLTWQDVEKNCSNIADEISYRCLDAVNVELYPISRGGYIPATIISHMLNIKIVNFPTKNSLVIDDIQDSGKTLNKFRGRYTIYVLVSKKNKIDDEKYDIFSSKYVDSDVWIKFPWEYD